MNITVNRNQLIIEMYNGGATLESIANFLGISRQRVLQIAKRKSNGIVRNRKLKKSNPRISEIWVKEYLDVIGIKNNYCGYGAECDLIANSYRLEVKHRKTASTSGKSKTNKYYKFSGLYSRNCDFYILITGEIKKHRCYIVPSIKVKTKSISIPEKENFKISIHQYLENWKILL